MIELLVIVASLLIATIIYLAVDYSIHYKNDLVGDIFSILGDTFSILVNIFKCIIVFFAVFIICYYIIPVPLNIYYAMFELFWEKHPALYYASLLPVSICLLAFYSALRELL